VHRDLKPANVLLHEGSALLADFGLARLLDLSTITQQGVVIGTPLYMAPEQTLGERVGPPADCFALGVMLFELLTGRHPFVNLPPGDATPAEAALEVFARIQSCEFPLPSALDPDIPPALEKVIQRALARRPEDRYRDGAEMLPELEAARKQLRNPNRILKWPRYGGGDAGIVSTAALPHTLSAADTRPRGTLRDADRADTERSGKEPPGGARPRHFRFGRYEIAEEIGHGAHGVVYRARDAALGRQVAIKLLQGGWNADRELQGLFWREARIAARLNHPHVIQIYDFGIENDVPFISMQLVDGPSLDRLLERREPLSSVFALEVLAQTADALGSAHEAGVLHLDVKPANILIRHTLRGAVQGRSDSQRQPTPHVVLTDFTVARLREAAVGMARSAGAYSESPDGWIGASLNAATVPYAAPEQLEGDSSALGPESDLYSLGVVFHEMLTGRRLFAGDNVEATKLLVLRGAVPPPSSLLHGLPAELDALCLKMLRRQPEERFRSAADAIAAAHKCLSALASSGSM
jgi:serine/threonine protein kinase